MSITFTCTSGATKTSYNDLGSSLFALAVPPFLVVAAPQSLTATTVTLEVADSHPNSTPNWCGYHRAGAGTYYYVLGTTTGPAMGLVDPVPGRYVRLALSVGQASGTTFTATVGSYFVI